MNHLFFGGGGEGWNRTESEGYAPIELHFFAKAILNLNSAL